MIQIRNLKFRYGDSFQLHLKAMDVSPSEKVAVVGRSGCGKTTLLNLIAGVQQPEAGEITVCQTRTDQLTDAQLRTFRAQTMGFVFQEFELIEYLNVRDNIMLPFELGTGLKRPVDLQDRLQHLLLATSLCDRERFFPKQLSQGQRQRVALCRALITQPKLILADEPTGSLDHHTATDVISLLVEQVDRLSATLVMVTHDNSWLDRFDQVVRLDEGSD